MKRVSVTILATITTVVLSAIFAPVASAADYTLTVTNTNLSRNQYFIFEEFNIGPGFAQNYGLSIINQSSGPISLTINGFEEDPGNTLTLGELSLVFKYGNTVFADLNNFTPSNRSICIAPDTTENFTLAMSFNRVFGNEYQDRHFKIEITFQADASDCSTGSNDKGGNVIIGLPQLPNTGEDQGAYYFLYGAVSVFTLLTIVMFIIFIITKKRKEKEEPDEKNII